MKNNKKSRLHPVIIVLLSFLAIYSIIVISLLLWGLLTSLKNSLDFVEFQNFWGLPNFKLSKNELLLGNYGLVFQNFTFKPVWVSYYSNIFGEVSRPPITQQADGSVNFLILIINSLIYAGGGSILSSFVAFLVAYLCAKYKFKFSKLVYTLVIVVMIIPIVGAEASHIALLMDLGIYNSIVGMWFQSFNFMSIYFLVFFAFFQGLSDSYLEAAEIDGSTQLGIFLKIIIPLSSKILGTVILMNFLTLWNDYQTPLLYYPGYPTLSYGVYMMSVNSSGLGAVGMSLPVKASGCIILLIPSLCIFLAFRNIIMGNLSMGGVKE